MPNEPLLNLQREAMSLGLSHVYLPAHPLLRPFIAHYTISMPFGSSSKRELALIPDVSGCLIFTRDRQTKTHYWGPTTRTVLVDDDGIFSPLRVFVEFRPGGAYALFGIPQQETADLQLELSEILPAFQPLFSDAVERSASVEELRGHLDTLFLSFTGRAESAKRPLSAASLLLNARGALSAKELARLTCYSERHLNRLICPVLGVSISGYTRILRINRALALLKQGYSSLTALGHGLGYYDQSHFNHDFKAVCGISPSQFQKNLSGFYNEPYKFSAIL